MYKIAQYFLPRFFILVVIWRGRMHPRKTMDRNREIFSSFKAGTTVESLAEQHGLTVQRIRALLIDEKHKHEISPEYFYQALRSAGLSN